MSEGSKEDGVRIMDKRVTSRELDDGLAGA